MMHRHYVVVLALSALLAACAAEKQAAEEVAKTSSHARGIVMSAREKNLLQLADASRRSDNTKDAAKLYRQAMDMSQGAVDAHLSLASLLVEKEQNIPAALEVLEQARALQPGNAEVLRQLGNGLVDVGKIPDALAVYTDWTTRIPGDPRAHNARGVALDLLDRHTEAQDAYHKGLARTKGDAGYIENNLALSLLSDGKYDEAITRLEKLHASAEDNETVRQNLALAYGLAGKPAKVAEILKGMTPQQVEENQKFYRYIRDQKQKKPEPPQAAPEATSAKTPEAVAPEPAPVKEPEAVIPEETPQPAEPKKEPLLEPEPNPKEELPEEQPAPDPIPVAEESTPESEPSINTLPTKRSVEKQEKPAPEEVTPAPEEDIPDEIILEDEEDILEEEVGEDDETDPHFNLESI